MRNKKYLIRSFIVIVIFTFTFIIINRLEYNQYKANFNYKINAILEVIQKKYPEIRKEEIIEILNSNDVSDSYLEEYGFNIRRDAYVIQNDKYNFYYSVLKLFLLLLSFVLLIYLFIKYIFRNDKEIDKIIKCIEKINHSNYELNIDEISEDKLSILKHEIYKTTVMLKENAENSFKDKINLKNSLQDISHQLKTPLTSINILLDNLMDEMDMDIETRQGFIRQIKREITNITFLVLSILKLSKFEANTVSFINEEVCVKKIISEAVINISNLCDLKDIKIKIKNNCKNKINCDFRWQVEAITNILKNAVEYSEQGNEVLVECEDNNVYTQIKIRDFGKGMDDVDMRNVFNRFYKGKNSSKDSIGIGLSLAKTIIEKNNGSITVESKKDVGTEFVIKYFYL